MSGGLEMSEGPEMSAGLEISGGLEMSEGPEMSGGLEISVVHLARADSDPCRELVSELAAPDQAQRPGNRTAGCQSCNNSDMSNIHGLDTGHWTKCAYG